MPILPSVIPLFAAASLAFGGVMRPQVDAFDKTAAELEALYSSDKLTMGELAARLQADYSRTLKPELRSDLKGLDEDGVKALFKSVRKVAFYSMDISDARDLGLIFAEAERRGVDVADDWNTRKGDPPSGARPRSSMLTDLHDAFLRSRAFEEARSLAGRHPSAGLPAVPAVKVSPTAGDAYRVYDVDDDGRAMTLTQVDWHHGSKVVMVFSPGCGFSQDAIEDIEADSSLWPIFKAHAVLVGEAGDMDFQSYAEWNRVHPELKGHLAHSMSDWPDWDLAATPQFYFLRDGKIVSHSGGWMRPASDRKAELAAGLQAIGLAGVATSKEASLMSEVSYFRKLSDDLQTRYSRGMAFQEFAKRLGGAYREYLKPYCEPAQWASLKDEDVRTIFQEVAKVAFYTETESHAHDLGVVFSEAERRKMDVTAEVKPPAQTSQSGPRFLPSMVFRLYKTYAQARLFDEARRLAAKYPKAGLPALPSVDVAPDAGPLNRVFEVSDDGRGLTLRSVEWTKGPRIVAVFSPTCSFSKRALGAIEADPAMLSAFKQHALLIAPTSEVLMPQKHVEWNRTHPGLQGSIAYKATDWPDVDLSSTPQFYFYRDGELLSHIDGWKEPVADRREELLKGLQALGLLTPDGRAQSRVP